jgi:hypothetical protein
MTITSAAEALFAGSLPPSERPRVTQASAAVRDNLRLHGGSPGRADALRLAA